MRIRLSNATARWPCPPALWALLAFLCAGAAAPPNAPSPLTSLAQIRQLTRAEAAGRLPVEAVGVVTYWDPASLLLCVQDASDGIFLEPVNTDAPLSVGRVVQVKGFTSAGEHSISIARPEVQARVEHSPLPSPKDVTVRRLLTGEEHGRWVQVQGVIQYADDNDGRWILWVRSGGKTLQAVVRRPPGNLEPESLVKQQVRLRGVCRTTWNDRHEVETTRLLVTSLEEDCSLQGALGQTALDQEVHSVADLSNWAEAGLPDRPIRLAGELRTGPGGEYLLRDPTGTIPLRPRNPVLTGAEFPCRAEGFLETDEGGRLLLADARVEQWAPLRPQRQAARVESGPAVPQPIITDAKVLRQLGEAEADRGYAVHLNGIVTYLDRGVTNLVIQDGAVGVYVDPTNSLPAPLAPGCWVVVQGYSGRGHFAPYVRLAQVRIAGERRLPSPWIGNPADLAAGAHDGRWIEIEGIVRTRPAEQRGQVRLQVATGGTVVEVCFPTGVVPAGLPGEDAKVRVRGVCDVLTREHRARGYRVLVCDPSQIQQLRAPVEKDQLRLSELDQLFGPSAALGGGHRVRVRAVVTLSRKSGLLFLDNGRAGLRAIPREPTSLALGDRVEVIGFPALSTAGPVLEEAEVVRQEPGLPLVPSVWDLSGSIDPSWDGRLVTLSQVRLVEKYRQNNTHVLVVESPHQRVLEVRCEGDEFQRYVGRLEPGSLMGLTGICQARVDADGVPLALGLWVRSRGDFQNIVAPTILWTPRLLQVFGLGVLAFCVSLGWVLSLRRQVGAQTEIIRNQLERKADLEHRHRQLIENANDLVFTLDSSGVFTSVNPACERVTGYTSAEALRMRLADWVVPEMRDRVREHLTQRSETELSAPYEVTIRTKDDRTVTLELSTRTLSSQGQVTGMQGIARDITERRHLQLQLHQAQKMESVGQLAAGVAHDFNNIMTVILGHGDLLAQETHLGKEARESCQQIASAAQRAAELTRQLLAFSRKQMMQPRWLDLNEVLANLAKMLPRLLGEHIDLRFDYGRRLPAIHADPGMLEQVVMNLCVNARDAMPRGGRLRIVTQRAPVDESAAAHNPEARPGEFVRLTVEDTGCGMDKATLVRIFEPFFTTKDVGRGTGLGLATVYGIVKQHEGWIEVASTPAQGTRFEIYLPALDRPPTTGPESSYPPAPQRGHECVLVVEDEPALRQLVERILRQCDYQVGTAATGRQALELWEQHQGRFDLLLTDMVMPDGLSGLDLAQRLRQHKPQLKILYTSGYSSTLQSVEGSLEADFRLLPKPFTSAQLLRAVRDCLEGVPSHAGPPAAKPEASSGPQPS